jgi:hypothetical protein
MTEKEGKIINAGELPCTLQMTRLLLLFRSLENCKSGYCTVVYIMYRKRRSFSQSSLPVTWTQLVQLKSGCARGHDICKLDMGFELCTSPTGS